MCPLEYAGGAVVYERWRGWTAPGGVLVLGRRAAQGPAWQQGLDVTPSVADSWVLCEKEE